MVPVKSRQGMGVLPEAAGEEEEGLSAQRSSSLQGEQAEMRTRTSERGVGVGGVGTLLVGGGGRGHLR